MKRTMKGMLTIGLLLGMATVALGYRQERDGLRLGGVLAIPEVQKELKLTDDQISKLKDALQKVEEAHRNDRQTMRDKPPAEQRKIIQAISEDSQKAISGVLDEKQIKRYHELRWQAAGPDGLIDPKFQRALTLSDEQKKKVETILENAAKKRRELIQAFNGGTMEKLQQVRKDIEEEINKVLTDEQKKKLKELKGKPFDFPPPPGRAR